MLSFGTRENVLKPCFPLSLKRNKEEKLILWLFPPVRCWRAACALPFTQDHARCYTQRLLPTAHTASARCLVLVLAARTAYVRPSALGSVFWAIHAGGNCFMESKEFLAWILILKFRLPSNVWMAPCNLQAPEVSEVPEHTTYGCEHRHWWWSRAPSHMPQDKPEPFCVRCSKAQEKRQHSRDVHEKSWISSGHHEMKGCKIDSFPERKPGFQKLTYRSIAMQSSLVYFRHWMTS